MSETVEGFLVGLAEQADGRYEIVVALRSLVIQSFPAATEVFKYGGLHYVRGAAPFAGIYVYRAHVSVEINGGASLDDPQGHLEGKGGTSGRKHVKIVALADVERKHVADYLAAAWELL